MRTLSTLLLFGTLAAGCEIFNGPAEPSEPEDDAGEFRGTTQATHVSRGGRVATMVDVNTDTHDDFDRLVFVFDDRVPGYHVEYVTNPEKCGSGDDVNPIGEHYLQVRFDPATMHTSTGDETVDGNVLVASDNVRQIIATCDFENQATWIIGLDSMLKYRVREMQDPPRLILDVQHDEDRVITQAP